MTTGHDSVFSDVTLYDFGIVPDSRDLVEKGEFLFIYDSPFPTGLASCREIPDNG